LILPLGAQVPVTQSRPAAAAVRADGQAGEWRDTAGVRDLKSGVKLAFQNDGRDLYILIVFQKPEALESLESTGLTILARTAAARKLERGVLFLKRTVPSETYIRWHEGQGTSLSTAEKEKLKNAVRQDLCLTFAIGARGSMYGPLRRLRESDPPEFGVTEDPDGLTYELKVPLALPGIVPGGIGASPGESVRISFEWGGKPRKLTGTKAIRETPPAEAGGLFGVATPAQEFLNMFDPMSRPTMGTKKYSVAIDVRLAEAK
jgi:hypothetical protein